MKQKKIYSLAWAFILGIGIAGGACSSDELPDGDQAEVRLQPHFFAATAETRSIVNGTAATAGADKINTVGLYVTQSTSNAVYPGVKNGKAIFAKQNDDSWEGDVKLGSIVARLYAFSPSGSVVTHANSSDTHTIPVSLSADQTFAGGTAGSEGNGWECSGTDYLYGTTTEAIEVTPAQNIEASNTDFSPSIYLHHALAQVVFKLQTVSGRPVDNTYDFVKKITLKATGSYKYFQTETGTMQLKDGLLGGLTAGNTLSFAPSVITNAVKCGANTSPNVVAYGLVAPMTAAPAENSITLTILLGEPKDDNTGERELTVTIPAPVKWEKGKRYLYTLNLSNRAITVEGTTEIKGWGASVDSEQDMKPDGF